MQFLVWERDEPGLVVLSMAKAPEAAPDNNRNVRVNAWSGEALPGDPATGFTAFLLKLHTEMFAGMGGKLFSD